VSAPGRRAGRIRIAVQRLPHADGLALPAYQTAGAAGLDLLAAVLDRAPIVLAPGARALVPTGLKLALPPGFEAQVRPRSGLALRHGITVLNSPGTIDCDYRGELQVLLINHGSEPFRVGRGERIAQLVVSAVSEAALTAVSELAETRRGAGGFGSTGTAAPRPTPRKIKPTVSRNTVPAKSKTGKPAKTGSKPSRNR